MNVKSFLTGAALLFASSTGHAGVVYEWVTIDNNMPINVTMRMEFEEAAVRKGSFNLSLEPGKQAVGDDGLISFSFKDLMHLTPEYSFPDDIGYFNMSLSFVHNNFFLTGTVRGADFGTRVNASSIGFGMNQDPRVFTIYDTNSDGLYPCYFEPNGACAGATGYLRQVPEPASIALLGLGAFGAFVARRKSASK